MLVKIGIGRLALRYNSGVAVYLYFGNSTCLVQRGAVPPTVGNTLQEKYSVGGMAPSPYQFFQSGRLAWGYAPYNCCHLSVILNILHVSITTLEQNIVYVVVNINVGHVGSFVPFWFARHIVAYQRSVDA